MATPGGEDRISNLPDNAREHILMCLPLWDAIKTSVLSTNWRNLWFNLPTLNFHNRFDRNSRGSINQNAAVNKLMFNLCRVLLLHRGPLRTVYISIFVLRHFPDQLDQILMFLQHKGIERLVMVGGAWFSNELLPLFDHTDKNYKVPSRLFTSPSFSQLRKLHLCRCEFTSSTISFEGFKMLTTLELRMVTFKDCSSTPWSFRCPLLSNLTLYGCGGFRQEPRGIVIEAPTLKRFHFVGHFRSLELKHTPLLRHATILKQSPLLAYDGDESGLLKIWGGLAAAKSLHITDNFYQYLAIGDAKSNVNPLQKLRKLTFDGVCLRRQNDAWSLLHMITSSPNLQRLAISLKIDAEVPVPVTIVGALEVCEFQDRTEYQDGSSKYELSQLERVEVKGMMGTEHEMAFVRWLLNSAPVLDEMRIQLLPTELEDAKKMSVHTELNGLQRSSTEARLMID